jgi:hypothetical protein
MPRIRDVNSLQAACREGATDKEWASMLSNTIPVEKPTWQTPDKLGCIVWKHKTPRTTFKGKKAHVLILAHALYEKTVESVVPDAGVVNTCDAPRPCIQRTHISRGVVNKRVGEATFRFLQRDTAIAMACKAKTKEKTTTKKTKNTMAASIACDKKSIAAEKEVFWPENKGLIHCVSSAEEEAEKVINTPSYALEDRYSSLYVVPWTDEDEEDE